ncbi:unnamed protein product [marine sediment metagenome]|uniref:Uncharacterized protein n=1 Tax=marine sediment metagenome TaxID=412755 RepID=X1FIT2_9ZZZZ
MNPKIIKCPECGGETFKITEERLSDRMFASAKRIVTCVGCLYSESLYKIGEEK